MKELITKNFIYILFALVILFVFISFLFISLTKNEVGQVSTNQVNSYTQLSSPPLGVSYSLETKDNDVQKQKGRLVLQMTANLPYQGKDFYLVYFYSSYVYQVTYYSGREDQGKKEFEQFLKDNQIEDRSWLDRLVIKVQ